MTTLTLLRAMNGIHEEDVIMAGKHYLNNEKPTRIKTKRIVTLALAAALILALGVGAYAAYGSVAGPEAAERVALEQIEEWKRLGLLSPEVELEGPAVYVQEMESRQGGSYWYGRIFPHHYDVRWFGEGKYNCVLHVDTLSGKITWASIEAQPDETQQPVPTETNEVPIDPDDLSKGYEKKTAYLYENFEDIFPADLTVDDYCSRLAEYWGFSGYRIADTVDDFYYDAHWEAVDGTTLLKDLPKASPSNYYLTVFFEGDQEGVPMYIQLNNFPTYASVMIGTNHGVG